MQDIHILIDSLVAYALAQGLIEEQDKIYESYANFVL